METDHNLDVRIAVPFKRADRLPKFGFKNKGVSESTHGGVVWYKMRLIF